MVGSWWVLLLVSGTEFRHLLQAGGSGGLCVMMVTHHLRDLGGGKICAETERALAAEARSMSLPLTGWVTPVTEAFEVETGLTKVRRKEKLAFKGGKREREGKTKQTAIDMVVVPRGKSFRVLQI